MGWHGIRVRTRGTYFLDPLVQELDVLAGAGVTLGLEVNKPDLNLIQGLLQRSLLLLKLDAHLALRCDVFLDLGGQGIGAPHLLYSGPGDVLLLGELGS